MDYYELQVKRKIPVTFTQITNVGHSIVRKLSLYIEQLYKYRTTLELV